MALSGCAFRSLGFAGLDVSVVVEGLGTGSDPLKIWRWCSIVNMPSLGRNLPTMYSHGVVCREVWGQGRTSMYCIDVQKTQPHHICHVLHGPLTSNLLCPISCCNCLGWVMCRWAGGGRLACATPLLSWVCGESIACTFRCVCAPMGGAMFGGGVVAVTVF